MRRVHVFQRTSNPSSSEHNALASPLLRLPAELRNLIYTYVISNNKYGEGGFSGSSDPETGEPIHMRLAPYEKGQIWIGLLLTCRQIHSETAPLPFALNTFCLIDSLIFAWFFKFATKQRFVVSTLRIEFTRNTVSDDLDDVGERMLDMVKAVPDLRRLEVKWCHYEGPLILEPVFAVLVKKINEKREAALQKWLPAGHYGSLEVVVLE